MIGKIYKIDQLKRSQNQGQVYYRLYFEMIDNDGKSFWAKTDIVPTYRNYQNWKNLMVVGYTFRNLFLRKPDEVNADSKPILIDDKGNDITMERVVTYLNNGLVKIEYRPKITNATSNY